MGLAQADAVGNVRALSDRLCLLAEDEKVHTRLLALLDTNACTGKQVHDANVVATMLVNGVDTVATLNTDRKSVV